MTLTFQKEGVAGSFGLSFGAFKDVSSHDSLRAELYLSIYRGGLGTPNGQLDTGYDLGFMMTDLHHGSETGDSMPVHLINRRMDSLFSNDYKNSGSLGGGFNFNFQTGDLTTHHMLGFRADNMAFNYENEMGPLPFLPAPGRGTDQGWTAYAGMGIGVGGGDLLQISTEQFTGIPDYNNQGYAALYNQPKGDQNLNRSETYIGVQSGDASFGVGFTGMHWAQNTIHMLRDISRFERTDSGGVFAETGVGFNTEDSK